MKTEQQWREYYEAVESKQNKKIGERIRKAREQKGWSQGQLELETGIERGHISRAELGIHRLSPKTLAVYSAALGVKLL